MAAPTTKKKITVRKLGGAIPHSFMDRFEDQLYIVLEKIDTGSGKWQHAQSNHTSMEEEEEAWGTFSYFKRIAQKGQRVRLIWRHVRYSPPTQQMKQMAINMAKNSNSTNKKIKIEVKAGERMRVLESMLIVEEYIG